MWNSLQRHYVRHHWVSLQIDSEVNLERSLAANGRIGGHVVQGHVDATGEVMSCSPMGKGLWRHFGLPWR